MRKVVHCKKEKYDLYIGRPSKWGNPYSHKEGTKAKYKVETRREAVEAYRDMMIEKIAKNPALLKELAELDGLVLGCWCKPKPCHGDVLVELSEWAAKVVTVPNNHRE